TLASVRTLPSVAAALPQRRAASRASGHRHSAPSATRPHATWCVRRGRCVSEHRQRRWRRRPSSIHEKTRGRLRQERRARSRTAPAAHDRRRSRASPLARTTVAARVKASPSPVAASPDLRQAGHNAAQRETREEVPMSNPEGGPPEDNIAPLMVMLSGALLAIMVIAYFVA